MGISVSDIDWPHIIVGSGATLLFFGMIWDLLRNEPLKRRRRPWRRFAILSILCLSLGLYASQSATTLVFIATWIVAVAMVIFVDKCESAEVRSLEPGRSYQNLVDPVEHPNGTADWSDLPPAAQRLIAAIEDACAPAAATDQKSIATAKMSALDSATFTFREALARYVPDTVAAYRRDRARLQGNAQRRINDATLATLSAEFIAQLERLHERLVALSAARPAPLESALQENRIFLDERFGMSQAE